MSRYFSGSINARAPEIDENLGSLVEGTRVFADGLAHLTHPLTPFPEPA
jgi:hypothetical protein